MNIRVKFKSEVSNPDYRYGDLNKPTRIPLEGEGVVISFSGDLFRCVVKMDNNKLRAFALDELEVIEERLKRRYIRR